MKFLILLMVLIALPSQAGYLELTNGDRLTGDLVRIEGDSLIWRSNTFGERAFNKLQIRNLSSSTPLKINGNKAPCIVERMEAEQILYYCGPRSQMNRVSLLSIKVMMPFDDVVEDRYVHQGRLGLNGLYSRGNEIRDEWNLNGELTLRRDELRHNLRGEYAEASWSHLPPTLKWQARYTLDWFFRERWFWSNNLTQGKEEQRGLDSYTSLASGTGYQFWESRESALSFKAGVAFFEEDYMEPKVIQQGFDPSDRYTAGQLGVDFRYTLPLGVGFFHNNEYTRSLDDDEKWYWKSATGLTAVLVGRISSEVKLDFNHDNQPQPGRKATDRRMSVGMSYRW